MTSLASQLDRLRQRPAHERQLGESFLFSKADAHQYSREQVHELALHGLRALVALDNRIDAFVPVLFDAADVRKERAQQHKEEAEETDRHIDQLCTYLAPHIFLPATHQVIEYLVRVHEAHRFNVASLLRLVLPVHDQGLFVRMIALLDLRGTGFDFLKENQVNGAPLLRSSLVIACGENRRVLRLVAECITKAQERDVRHHAALALWLGVVTALATSPYAEAAFRVVLPTLLDWLGGSEGQALAAALVSLCAWATEVQFPADVLALIAQPLIKASTAASTTGVPAHDVLRCVAHLFNTQRDAVRDAAFAPCLRQLAALPWADLGPACVAQAGRASPLMLTTLWRHCVTTAHTADGAACLAHMAAHAVLRRGDVSVLLEATACKVMARAAGGSAPEGDALLAALRAVERRFSTLFDAALAALVDRAAGAGDGGELREAVFGFVAAHFAGTKFDLIDVSGLDGAAASLPVLSCLLHPLAAVRRTALEKLLDAPGPAFVASCLDLAAHCAATEAEPTVQVAAMQLLQRHAAAIAAEAPLELFAETVDAASAIAAACGAQRKPLATLLGALRSAVPAGAEDAAAKVQAVAVADAVLRLVSAETTVTAAALAAAAETLGDESAAAAALLKTTAQDAAVRLVGAATAGASEAGASEAGAGQWVLAKLALCIVAAAPHDGFAALLPAVQRIARDAADSAARTAVVLALLQGLTAAAEPEEVALALLGLPAAPALLAAKDTAVAAPAVAAMLRAACTVAPTDAAAPEVAAAIGALAARNADVTSVAGALCIPPAAAQLPALAAARQRAVAAVIAAASDAAAANAAAVLHAEVSPTPGEASALTAAAAKAVIAASLHEPRLACRAAAFALRHGHAAVAAASLAGPALAVVRGATAPGAPRLALTVDEAAVVAAFVDAMAAVAETPESADADAWADAATLLLQVGYVAIKEPVGPVPAATTAPTAADAAWLPCEPLLGGLLEAPGFRGSAQRQHAATVPLVELYARGCAAAVPVLRRAPVLLEGVADWAVRATTAATDAADTTEDPVSRRGATPAARRAGRVSTGPTAGDSDFVSAKVDGPAPLLELWSDVLAGEFDGPALVAAASSSGRLVEAAVARVVRPEATRALDSAETAATPLLLPALRCTAAAVAALGRRGGLGTAGDAPLAQLRTVLVEAPAGGEALLPAMAPLVLHDDLATSNAACDVAAAVALHAAPGEVAADCVQLLARAVGTLGRDDEGEAAGAAMTNAAPHHVPAVTRLLQGLLPALATSRPKAASDSDDDGPAIFVPKGGKAKARYTKPAKAKAEAPKAPQFLLHYAVVALLMRLAPMRAAALKFRRAEEVLRDVLLAFSTHDQLETVIGVAALFTRLQHGEPAVTHDAAEGAADMAALLSDGPAVLRSLPAAHTLLAMLTEHSTFIRGFVAANAAAMRKAQAEEAQRRAEQDVTSSEASDDDRSSASDVPALKGPGGVILAAARTHTASVYLRVVVAALEWFAASRGSELEAPAADLLSRFLSLVDEPTFVRVASALVAATPASLRHLLRSAGHGTAGAARGDAMAEHAAAVRGRGLQILYDRLVVSVAAASPGAVVDGATVVLTASSAPLLPVLCDALRAVRATTVEPAEGKRKARKHTRGGDETEEGEAPTVAAVSAGHTVVAGGSEEEAQWVVACAEELARLLGSGLLRFRGAASSFVELVAAMSTGLVAGFSGLAPVPAAITADVAAAPAEAGVSVVPRVMTTLAAAFLTALATFAEKLGYGFMAEHAAASLAAIATALQYGTHATAVAAEATPAGAGAVVLRHRALLALRRALPATWVMAEPFLPVLLLAASRRVLCEADAAAVDVRELFFSVDALFAPRVLLPVFQQTLEDATPAQHSFALIFETTQRIVGKMHRRDLREHHALMSCELFTAALERFAAAAQLPSEQTLAAVFSCFGAFALKFKEEQCLSLLANVVEWAFEVRPTDSSVARRDCHRWTLALALFEAFVRRLGAVAAFALPLVTSQLVEVLNAFAAATPALAKRHPIAKDPKLLPRASAGLGVALSLARAVADATVEANAAVGSAAWSQRDPTDGGVPTELLPFTARKESFAALMPALCQQISNTVILGAGVEGGYEARIADLVVPAVRRFFKSLQSPKLWSQTQAEILKALRHPEAEARKATLTVLRAVYEDGGDELAALVMAEGLPAIVECTEDESDAVVEEARLLCQELSTITGQDVLHAMA